MAWFVLTSCVWLCWKCKIERIQDQFRPVSNSQQQANSYRPAMAKCSLRGALNQLVWRGQCLYETMLLGEAIRLLLIKCYDSKMVKLPGCFSIGTSSSSLPTKKKLGKQFDPTSLFKFICVFVLSSLHWFISLSLLILFFYNGVCQTLLKLSISDNIISQKGSNGDGKLHCFGWDYILLTLIAQKNYPLPAMHSLLVILDVRNIQQALTRSNFSGNHVTYQSS